MKRRWLILTGVIVALVSLVFLVAACDDDEDEDGTPTEPAVTEPAAEEPTPTAPAATEPAVGATADVDLTETPFSVTASPESASAGDVTFNVSNTGVIVHNFRAIKTDLAPDALPTADGQADESQLDVVASSSDLDGGGSEEVAATLETGSYVLICNIVGHYEAGMTTAFTVE